MADIKFNCPKCKKHLEVDEEGAGERVNCPSCNSQIVIPAMPEAVKIHLPIKQKPKRGNGITLFLIVIIAILGVIWMNEGGPAENRRIIMNDINKQTKQEMDRIKRDVASDAVKEYEIAKRSGSRMDAYVHAGLVAAAYLQAQDELNYQKWKAVERNEGQRAGMPEDMLK